MNYQCWAGRILPRTPNGSLTAKIGFGRPEEVKKTRMLTGAESGPRPLLHSYSYVFNHPALRSSLSPCQTTLFSLLHRVLRRAAHRLVPPLYQDRQKRRRGLARRMVSKRLCHVGICGNMLGVVQSRRDPLFAPGLWCFWTTCLS